MFESFEHKLTIAAGHPSFAGHFPGQPMAPAVVLLDEVLQALESAIEQSSAFATFSNLDFEVASAKFLDPVLPNDDIRILLTVKNNNSLQFEVFTCRGKAAVGAIIGVEDPA